MSDNLSPREALAQIRAARAAAAGHIHPHWIWDLAMALATGGVFAAYSAPPPWGAVVMVPFALAMPLLSALERRRFGLQVRSFGTSPRSRALGALFGLVLATLVVGVILSSLLLDLRWPALAAAGVATIFTYYCRRAWLGAIQDDISGAPSRSPGAGADTVP